MHGVLSLILGGGRGARLFPLTRGRSEPAVPIAGKYRLIDIPISNCINSGLNRIYVLTQFHSVSLHRHITNSYKFDAFSQGFVELLAAQQTNETANWYRGTADALRQNSRYIQEDTGQEVLVLSGDQLYRMDFRDLLGSHVSNQADLTVAVTPVTAAQASQLGVIRLDDNKRLLEMVEKPRPDKLPALRSPPEVMKGESPIAADREYLANMGIYLFRREFLIEVLAADPAMDLVTQVFPRLLKERRVFAHPFTGYWQDVGTIRSYFEASLALTGDTPPFDFHTPHGVIFTHKRYLPASRLQGASMKHTLISDGCVIEPGAKLERCIVGVRSRIGRNVTLRDTVMLGANPSESVGGDDGLGPAARHLGIGEDAVLERVILDKNVRIGRGARIVNQKQVQTADGPGYFIRDGIVVIPKDGVIPEGAVI
jgi:glucose-1-phosphate adenylyltransferase